jgi:predicted lysophospholipase L1 biosynthesis ABC-type transport system permease subunit
VNQTNGTDQEDVRVTQEVAARAIRRLNVLEWVILGGAGLIAVLGGALVSWLIAAQLKVSFRLTWIGLSMLLLVVPGLTVILRSGRGGSTSTVISKLKTKEKDG